MKSTAVSLKQRKLNKIVLFFLQMEILVLEVALFDAWWNRRTAYWMREEEAKKLHNKLSDLVCESLTVFILLTIKLWKIYIGRNGLVHITWGLNLQLCNFMEVTEAITHASPNDKKWSVHKGFLVNNFSNQMTCWFCSSVVPLEIVQHNIFALRQCKSGLLYCYHQVSSCCV